VDRSLALTPRNIDTVGPSTLPLLLLLPLLAAQNAAVGHSSRLMLSLLPNGVAGAVQLPWIYTDTLLPKGPGSPMLAAQNEAVGHSKLSTLLLPNGVAGAPQLPWLYTDTLPRLRPLLATQNEAVGHTKSPIPTLLPPNGAAGGPQLPPLYTDTLLRRPVAAQNEAVGHTKSPILTLLPPNGAAGGPQLPPLYTDSSPVSLLPATQNEAVGHTNVSRLSSLPPNGAAGGPQLPPLYTDTLLPKLPLSPAAQNEAVGHTKSSILTLLPPNGAAGGPQLPPLYTDTLLPFSPSLLALLATQNEAVGHTKSATSARGLEPAADVAPRKGVAGWPQVSSAGPVVTGRLVGGSCPNAREERALEEGRPPPHPASIIAPAKQQAIPHTRCAVILTRIPPLFTYLQGARRTVGSSRQWAGSIGQCNGSVQSW